MDYKWDSKWFSNLRNIRFAFGATATQLPSAGETDLSGLCKDGLMIRTVGGSECQNHQQDSVDASYDARYLIPCAVSVDLDTLKNRRGQTTKAQGKKVEQACV